MWLLKKNHISRFLLPFYSRLKLEYILPITIKKPIIKYCNLHDGYGTIKYRGRNYVLSWCNVMKHRLNNFFIDIQNYLFFEHHFRFEIMNFSPLQGANLIFLVSEPTDGVGISRDTHIQCEVERMCEIAKETWLKGNLAASFKHFSSLYDKGDKDFQIKLIKIMQGLVGVSVKKSGMAIVANITKHVKKFCNEKNEFSVLMTLWYALFISSLYDDNCLSETLLEDLDFKVYLEPLIPSIGANFLKHNEVANYQRLIETSLTHNLDNAAGILLRLLFNYYYKTGYFSGCSAVYECCIELDIKLTKDQIYKYSLLKKTGTKIKRSQVIKHPEDLIYKF